VIWANDAITDLGTLGGPASIGYVINDLARSPAPRKPRAAPTACSSTAAAPWPTWARLATARSPRRSTTVSLFTQLSAV